MPRFVHIDHSLCRVGGHEYDYAMNILRTAEADGYEVLLAVNRHFRDRAAIPGHWPVYPIFRHTAHTRNCVSLGGHDHLPIGTDGRQLPPVSGVREPDGRRRLLERSAAGLAGWRRFLSRRRRIRHFAGACKHLFARVGLDAGDQVFLATFTEFDLLGLTSFLTEHPQTRAGVWHLQFHFDLFAGCGEDAAGRDQRIDVVRRQFRYALDQLPGHRLHFYNTTAELAAQYNELGVATFRHLPYPVNPALESPSRPPGEVLRVTCAGGMRREKGIWELGTTVNSLRTDPFFDGRIEIAAQLPLTKILRLGIYEGRRPPGGPGVRVIGLRYPLTIDSYHDLIRQTDIGLFLYDNRRYHVRCSGILQEMLAAGKPVIVPAGCWLAEQIAEPVARQVEYLTHRLPRVDQLAACDITWTRTGRGQRLPKGSPLELTFTGSEPVRTELPRPPSATELVLAFRRIEPVEPGTYVHVRTEQFDRDANRVQQFDSILGCRRDNLAAPALIHLDPRSTRIAVELKNAYHGGTIAITEFTADFLDASEAGGCPAGRVGLIAADSAHVPVLLREMVDRYRHYRETAEAFSREWIDSHHPARTIDILSAAGTTAVLNVA